MWKIIYNLLTICALPFFIVIGLSKGKTRKNFRRRLIPAPHDGSEGGACMIHGASVGEAMIALGIAGYLEENTGIRRFLFTTNTSYAQEMLEKKTAGKPGISVRSLPFDLLFSVRRFLDQERPSSLIIVETEIWPNLIWQSNRRGIPVIVINGRISDSTLESYRRLSFFMRSALRGIDAVIAQSDEHRNRFISIGMAPRNVFATGNIKYYRPAGGTPVAGPAREKIITLGSVKEKELDEIYLAAELIKGDLPDHTVCIAPREIHLAGTIEKDLSGSFRTVRYSKLRDSSERDITGADIVVVDTVGDLMGIYARSAIAFVGGSLAPYGGQNMLEPLFAGTPVLFGPFTENFKDIAGAILEKKAGFLVETGSEIHKCVMRLLGDDRLYSATQKAGQAVIAGQQSVMAETANIIVNVLGAKKGEI